MYVVHVTKTFVHHTASGWEEGYNRDALLGTKGRRSPLSCTLDWKASSATQDGEASSELALRGADGAHTRSREPANATTRGVLVVCCLPRATHSSVDSRVTGVIPHQPSRAGCRQKLVRIDPMGERPARSTSLRRRLRAHVPCLSKFFLCTYVCALSPRGRERRSGGRSRGTETRKR